MRTEYGRQLQADSQKAHEDYMEQVKANRAQDAIDIEKRRAARNAKRAAMAAKAGQK